jgi:hypothetical protein
MTEKKQRKNGRPALTPGQPRVSTSVSLTRDLQVLFYRLGGSKWLRETIAKAAGALKK